MTYTTPELAAILLPDAEYQSGIRELQRADRHRWLVPSVQPRRGSGYGPALYNDEDLYVGRVVLAVYPVSEHGHGDYPLNNRRRDVALRVRQFQGWEYLILGPFDGERHAGTVTDDPADVIAFCDQYPAEIVKVVNLSQFRQGREVVLT